MDDKGQRKNVLCDLVIKYPAILSDIRLFKALILDYIPNDKLKRMNYDPAELAALLSEPWSNGACRGYVIMAMENCGFAGDDIRRIMAELHELFDFVSLEEAEAHYQKSLF